MYITIAHTDDLKFAIVAASLPRARRTLAAIQAKHNVTDWVSFDHLGLSHESSHYAWRAIPSCPLGSLTDQGYNVLLTID